MSSTITKQMRDFCKFYVKLARNGRQAAIAAGYAESNAAAAASKMIKRDDITTIIDRLSALAIQAEDKADIMEITEAKARLTRIARADIGDYLDANGEIDPDLLNDFDTAAIAELTPTKTGIKVKLHNPMQALEKLAKMQGWDQQGGGDITINLTKIEMNL